MLFRSYEVYLNGILTEPSDQGQMDVFLGRTDIYLKRKDSGHGLSERLEVTKLEDKIYFVRDTARKKMGKDFIEQLFLHPNECTPALDGDILNYLSIYAKIHEKAEIYIAVPQYGNPNRVWVWRYDRPSANLQLVRGGADGFPVRFALLVQGGIMYNDATVEYDETKYQDELKAQAGDPGAVPDPAAGINAKLGEAYIPVAFELRGHYNRLMLAIGGEFGFGTGGQSGDTTWIETYRTPGEPDAQVVLVEKEAFTDPDTGETSTRNVVKKKVYNERMINRDLYFSTGVVFGRDAGIGFGPRLAFRVGWTNVPYALQTTAHLGWTLAPPGIKPLGDRVRPFVDVDGRVGASWPFIPSLAHTDPISVSPVFGIVAGVGTTF